MGKVTGFIEYGRKTPDKRPVSERVNDYLEIYIEPGEEEIQAQGARCMDCGVPFCNDGCRSGTSFPTSTTWSTGESGATRSTASTGPTAFQNSRGGSVPRRASRPAYSPSTRIRVTIEFIEKAIVERGFAEGWVVPQPPARRTGKKVAVVGSGPAGLAAAQRLNRTGHLVTVFERNDRVGGPAPLRYPGLQAGEVGHRSAPCRAAGRGVELRTGVHVESPCGRANSSPSTTRYFFPRVPKLLEISLCPDETWRVSTSRWSSRAAEPARRREADRFRREYPREWRERLRARWRGHRLGLHRNEPSPGRANGLQLRASREASRRSHAAYALADPPAPLADLADLYLAREEENATGASRPRRSRGRTASSKSYTAARVRFGEPDRATGRRPMETVPGSGVHPRCGSRAAGTGIPRSVRDGMLEELGVELTERGNVATDGYATSVPGSMRRVTCGAASPWSCGQSRRGKRRPRRSTATSAAPARSLTQESH